MARDKHSEWLWLRSRVRAAQDQATIVKACDCPVRTTRDQRFVKSAAYIMPDNIRADLRDFIVNEVGSIAQLELLLLLHQDARKDWNAEEAARALYTAADATAALLEGFRARGFVTVSDTQPPRYQFASRKPEHEQLVRDLAELYQTRRVTVINLIYAGPEQKLRSFADAFRLRKRKEE